MADGEANLLTADPVLLFEPTSGSSAATKLIPYTAALKRDFQRGIAPWIVHTFAAHPALFRGRAYWSVSPILAENRRTVGGVPIGFEEDSSYLGGWAGRLVNAVLAVPAAVKQIPDMASFRYVTLRFLLACPDLALISVWNPTFLTLLVAPLAEWGDRLVADIRHGQVRPPGDLSPHVHAQLARNLRPDPRRADEIAHILAATDDAATRHRRLWPDSSSSRAGPMPTPRPMPSSSPGSFPKPAFSPRGCFPQRRLSPFPWPKADLVDRPWP